jgi:hypothetical protein
MVPVSVDFFLGLITHPRTTFPDARSELGLASQLGIALRACGATVELEIFDQNLLVPGAIALNRNAVKDAIDAESQIELRWREYLTDNNPSLAFKTFTTMRKTWRALQLAPPWKRKIAESDRGAKMLSRLANIELAHVAAVRRAVESGAKWVIILEDDAESMDPQSLALGLMEFTAAATNTGQPSTMNLTESFTPDQLGIQHLLTARSNEGQPCDWKTSTSEKLITNTVCAVLYERTFLETLLDRLESIPIEPIVPIDFKINAAYMNWPDQKPGMCWVCTPAPVTQGSGVPKVRFKV